MGNERVMFQITELNNELVALEEQTQKEAHDIAFVNDQLAGSFSCFGQWIEVKNIFLEKIEYKK